MKNIFALCLLTLTAPAYATTYTIAAGASTQSIQSTLTTAGGSPGNTVVFSAGSYRVTDTLTLPCSNGTVYTGPNVGVVTQNHLPTAVLSISNASKYVMSTDSNNASLTGSHGCSVQYLRFSGTQGGILVYYPASGITIQNNAFDNNNPPAGGNSSEANIYLTGENWESGPNSGVTNITITWNVFFSNCASIRAAGSVESGGRCASTWVQGYNNGLTWSNNTVNLTEEGLKLSQEQSGSIGNLNLDVENNNMQGNSRIMIEAQQVTNGKNLYSHNAFYRPNDPGFNTFELSIPEWLNSIAPTQTVNDNVFIGDVPVTIGGSGAHYGIGVELWGPGSIATNNLFQGGNGGENCAAGWGCSGWGITVGEPFTNAVITGNYFSGTDVWNGGSNDVGQAVQYEDGGARTNTGLILSPNTVVETSTTIATAAPKVSVSGSVVTLSNSNNAHAVTIFYTTDGSNPAIFGPGQSAGSTHVYGSPFSLPAGGVVKAIASWGVGANQGITFPSFGYVPSQIVTATVSATAPEAPSNSKSSSTPTLKSAYLGNKGSANSMTTGGTLQFTVYGVYSDGVTRALPNSYTTTAIAWNTSNHTVAKVSAAGHVTALAAGKADVKATVAGILASPWTVTVNAAKPTAAAAMAKQQAFTTNASSIEPQSNISATAALPESTRSYEPSVPSEPPTPQPEPVQPEPTSPGSSSGTESGSGSGPNTPNVPGSTGDGGPSKPVIGPVTAGPIPASPGRAVADNFQGPFWNVVSPGGGTASISGSHLFLGVPGGSNHDALTANQAVRVVQSIGSQDFDVAMKIDSQLYATDNGTSQGLMVLSDDKNYLTFALTTDGSKIGLKAHTVLNGSATTVYEDADLSSYANPMYLRLAKQGSSYVAYDSSDGANWNQLTTFTFTRNPTQIGPFASNYSENPEKTVPVVMSVNWFDVAQ